MRDRLPGAAAQQAVVAFSICTFVVLVLTLMPVAIPNHFPQEDKLHHILAFGALTVLACAAWSPRWWKLIPSLVADTVGVVLAWLVYPVFLKIYLHMPSRRNS